MVTQHIITQAIGIDSLQKGESLHKIEDTSNYAAILNILDYFITVS